MSMLTTIRRRRPSRAPRARTALAVACALAGGLSAATPAHAATSIVVDATHPEARIRPAVFGSTFLAPDGGLGSYVGTSRFSSTFLSDLDGPVYVGSLRFPGGITGESYHWQNAIGPESGRQANPTGPFSGPSPSTVGPDEFGALLDRTGATGLMTVNFATGSATDAADLVHYMTDPAGSGSWANLRAADGHPAPYDVPYWEVGNEEYGSNYWRTGAPVSVGGPPGACAYASTCEYIYGGTTSFTGQAVVQPADRTAGAGTADGSPHQTFQVAYPPVAGGSAAISVGATAWTQVSQTQLATAPSTAPVYTLDPSTGTIRFGDGIHGAIPPAGQPVTATYESGPHQGFDAFYAAMKQANPGIHICATDTTTDFIDSMGSAQPYDCLQKHPYVGSGDISPGLPIGTYETQVMAVPATEADAVKTLGDQVRQATGRSVPIELSEYGQLISSTPDRTQVPYYLNSLDEALVNASQLAEWIRLGIPIADRQLLTAELPGPGAVADGLPGSAPYAVTGAITTTGSDATVVQPTGEYLGLMSPLAGGRQLSVRTFGDPSLTAVTGVPVGDLSTVAAATSAGVVVTAINRSPTASLPARITLRGFTGSGQARVSTLNGPDALSDNTSSAPDLVTTTSSTATVQGGAVTLTLPAHSITRVTIRGL